MLLFQSYTKYPITLILLLDTSDYSNLPAKSAVIVENILTIKPPEKFKKPNCIEITFMSKDKIKYNPK